VTSSITTYNFSGQVQTILQNYCQNIPSSVSFDSFGFDFSIYSILYPQDSNNNYTGVVFNVGGVVSYNGTPYSGTLPSDLTVATVDSSVDINLNLSMYEFNAWLWGLFSDNLLNYTVDINNPFLTDPDEMYTSYWSSDPNWAPILKLYANNEIQVGIAIMAAPTVTIQQNLSSNNALALTRTTDFTVSIQSSDGTYTQLAVIEVVETDWLNNFALTANSSQQDLVTFTFQIAAGEPVTATLKSSVIPISPSTFQSLWTNQIRPAYANFLGTLGSNGIPIPSIGGMQLTNLVNLTLTLGSDYATLAINAANSTFNS